VRVFQHKKEGEGKGLLKAGIILLAYLVVKAGCVIINESEKIQFSVPKILERTTLGVIAFATQVMFF
jgi:hypothetical protein